MRRLAQAPPRRLLVVHSSGVSVCVHGLAGMAEASRGILTPWEEFRVAADEYRELDGERVLVLNHFSGRGKTSGVDVREIWAKAASLFCLRGGKVIRLVQYWAHQRALADLGLAPGGGSPDL